MGDDQRLAGGSNISARHLVEHLPLAASVRNFMKLFAGQTDHGLVFL
ncbi:hypothetical protein N5C70_27705 [Pseudomonas juntendi]|uniref:Uncharacterized protein n=1 Tax=Pseudomonas juntendi TaxID=2666183 RepID=A0ABD4YMC2_9PSED|nr:hypothetical protein [Pseudomonas juntendi]MCF3157318.1 hypothetical protein [Pseudomonas juntendi]MDH0760452.1 hypothetical protein [Pseudomonas juntendi]MDH1917906.1 hypothetical protein [Pseudomonas juntendi]